MIQKYISVAKYCSEMRNFATCVQVVDALEMFVVRQLPVSGVPHVLFVCVGGGERGERKAYGYESGYDASVDSCVCYFSMRDVAV